MYSLQLILNNLRYFAPCFVFASLNIITSTWVLYIPHIKDKLQITDGQLGVALFCLALGILTIIPFVPKITKYIGLGKYTFTGIVFFCLTFILPFLANTYIHLCITLFMVGIFIGSTDIAMNALVSEVEKKDSQNFMSAAHGFFSLGGVIGAGFGSLFFIERLSALSHIALVVCVVLLINTLLFKYYVNINIEEHHREKRKLPFRKLKIVLPLALVAFIIMASEGAIEHWSKLYLLNVVEVESDRMAGYGFVLFSATMTIGRFFGDGISVKIGSRATISCGILLSLIGFICMLVASIFFSLIGFALVGLGLSVVIPELFRLAGRTKNIPSTVGISFVSGIGFFGFLLGPVILGLISDNYGLRMSFAALLALLLLAFLVTFFQKIVKV